MVSFMEEMGKVVPWYVQSGSK